MYAALQACKAAARFATGLIMAVNKQHIKQHIKHPKDQLQGSTPCSQCCDPSTSRQAALASF
jgi:hypothetical protein